MAIMRLMGFIGEIPKLIPRLLPDNAAQRASNTRLTNGGLEPVRQPRFVQTFPDVPVGGYQTIYRNGDEWLAWEGLVHAAPGPVADDRLYFTGDGVPQMRVDATDYPLAVEGPDTALSASVSGTSTSDLGSTRLYVYTLVTEFGEESEPSPLSDEVYWEPGQAVELSGFSTTMANGRTATLQRIYRSQTSTTGTQLYFIAERAAATTNFTDNIPADQFQEPLPSLDWNTPPDDLSGLIALPNGMMAAFVGKDLYFSEPFRPHAWPEKYVITMDYPIVALGAFGQSVAVLTEGNPTIVTGTAPENMVSERLELNLPCINPRGVQDLGYAVAYPSYDGLVLVSQGGARIATEQLMSREDWLQFNPESMRTGQYDGRYYATFIYSDPDVGEVRGTLIIDTTSEQGFIIRSDLEAGAFFFDLPSGDLYYLDGADLFEWDAPGQANKIQEWRSKQMILPKPTNFGAILVEAEDFLTAQEIAELEALIQEILDYNAAIFMQDSIGGEINGAEINAYAVNGDEMKSVPSLNRNLSVNVYADGKLVANVSRYNQMARLPSGFLARRWEVEIVGDMPVLQVTMAGTGAELRGVP